jgi:hypothetical protein
LVVVNWQDQGAKDFPLGLRPPFLETTKQVLDNQDSECIGVKRHRRIFENIFAELFISPNR